MYYKIRVFSRQKAKLNKVFSINEHNVNIPAVRLVSLIADCTDYGIEVHLVAFKKIKGTTLCSSVEQLLRKIKGLQFYEYSSRTIEVFNSVPIVKFYRPDTIKVVVSCYNGRYYTFFSSESSYIENLPTALLEVGLKVRVAKSGYPFVSGRYEMNDGSLCRIDSQYVEDVFKVFYIE